MAKEKLNQIKNPEDLSLKFSLPVMALSYLFFVTIGLIYKYQGVVLTNRQLSYSIIAASVFVPLAILFSSFYKRFKDDAVRLSHKFTLNYWLWKSTLISLAYTIIFGLIGTGVSIVIALTFKDFTYQFFTYALWPTIAVGFWTYFTINLGKNFKATDMVNLIGVFLIGGVTLSAILNPNPEWWNESISYLGMNNYKSATILNVALIFSGFLLLTLSTFIIRRFGYMLDSKMITKRSFEFLKYSFIIAPIGLACVGIFPYKPEMPREMIHNLSAFAAFGLLAMVILFTYWIMPIFSKYYLRLNYLIFALLAGIMVLNVTGYLTLALTETMAFGIISVWLILFLRSVDGILDWDHNELKF